MRSLKDTKLGKVHKPKEGVANRGFSGTILGHDRLPVPAKELDRPLWQGNRIALAANCMTLAA